MKPHLKETQQAREDYSKIFNTLAGLSVLGMFFIIWAIPVLSAPEVEAAELPQGNFTQLDISVVNNIGTSAMPDVSYAFELKAKEDAKIRIDDVQALIDMALSIKPPREYVPQYELEYVGEFYITMYAATVEQCGNSLGITASGRPCTDDPTCWTVAVDPKIIPLGTYLKIDLEGYEDVIFRADDTGSAINNYDIDIFSSSEAESKAFPCYSGVKVWIVVED